MRWPMFILVAAATAMVGCRPPEWERMENPDIKDQTAMAAVDSFVATYGWNMNKSPMALVHPGGGRQGRFRGLPWTRLADSSYPALTSRGIFYVALKIYDNNASGVAYNPDTNQFPREVAGFKPLADHWYVWTFVGAPAGKPKLTRRYEGEK
jgi:hypothetical protein